jgi:hypothetical protein
MDVVVGLIFADGALQVLTAKRKQGYTIDAARCVLFWYRKLSSKY